VQRNGRVSLRKLSATRGRKLLDRQARQLLGMSGDEFARKWKRGEFADPDRPEIMRVAMLLGFGG
jgi:hypothetical protein